MGCVQRKKRIHMNNKELSKKFRLRRRTKDLDQVEEDLKPENAEKLKNLPIDYDLPGAGQFYCLQCSKYYISDDALEKHSKSKVHKRRLKELKEGAYTQEEAERAGGRSGIENKRPSTMAT
ncbi:hypothetical protein SARC_05877 [Sphaeroforma arctica JP610]|uniref:C2H2-type domain-containing protein n=1 Tax=Sphaeroforma arctica JP610 TaxID=667725 RepID=A0A0L0FYW7_9EUKA|nr:hypothetical protein SARC_05877 [Sphaeroforma arctica JP610]KNC81824.1 hypothetical protein SARC_05877 [Sphaeroforma arctica JP610]|eukprot:XP_014155726.1 hypothetical protein SARC_05877 [Sphaeroforma arctica JP610]